MLKDKETVQLIFGLKIQHLRREKNLSYQQLSDRTGLAISYLHNIEKGKKYPKADKIFALARALDTDYNYLVSLEADKKIQPIVDLLRSDFLKIFPLETFGINTPKLLELLAMAPDKVNAFVSTVSKIIRNHHLQGEDFYKTALRSYQDLHDNYFGDIEEAVRRYRQLNKLPSGLPVQGRLLEQCLMRDFQIRVDRQFLPLQEDLRELRSYFSPEEGILYLSDGLSTAQENFLLAKELGFQVMKINDRPLETRMIEVYSFDQLLHNFRASYFSVAFLMEEDRMIAEIEKMARWKKWDADAFLALLDRFEVTPEMLLQRLANILPRHFDIRDLFFLRFYTGSDLKKFEMTKEMHLSQLHNPHANQLDEHYCRRWISISLIRRLKAMQGLENTQGPIADAQVSRYWGTPNAYFCICMAKPSRNEPGDSTSVTIGLLVDEKLKKLFPFLEDPGLGIRDVHTTCERCAIRDCEARAAPPTALQNQRSKEKIKAALARLGSKSGVSP